MLLNPFARFNEKFIEAFRNAGKQYLVSQAFTRENTLFKDSSKVYLLLSHYDDLSKAKFHLSAIKADLYAAIINLENEKHRIRLLDMTKPTSSYILYSILDPDPKATKIAFDKIFKYKIQNFIAAKTDWRISREQTYVPHLETTFGELFVVLRYSGREIRLQLAELENF